MSHLCPASQDRGIDSLGSSVPPRSWKGGEEGRRTPYKGMEAVGGLVRKDVSPPRGVTREGSGEDETTGSCSPWSHRRCEEEGGQIGVRNGNRESLRVTLFLLPFRG